MLTLNRHGDPETTTINLPHEVLKNSENGAVLPHVSMATTVDRPTPTAGLYTSNVKDPGSIKSPQLPVGENVAVATGAQ